MGLDWALPSHMRHPGHGSMGGTLSRFRVPDAVQRERKRSDAPPIRDRSKLGVRNDPGSAAHHFATLHAALRPGNAVNLARMGYDPGSIPLRKNVLQRRWIAGSKPGNDH